MLTGRGKDKSVKPRAAIPAPVEQFVKCSYSQNYDLGKTQITDKVCVSSAALWREEYFGNYFLVETWCFSDDPRQRSFQIIHGTPHSVSEKTWEVKDAWKIHAYVVEGLRRKLCL